MRPLSFVAASGQVADICCEMTTTMYVCAQSPIARADWLHMWSSWLDMQHREWLLPA